MPKPKTRSASKRTLTLENSDKIFQHPDGTINNETLESLLSDAITEELPKSQKIYVTHEERVKRFNPSNPRWKTVRYKTTVGKLMGLYKSIHGEEYSEPDGLELEKRYARNISGIGFGRD